MGGPGSFDRRKHQSFALVATVGAVIIIINLLLISGIDVRTRVGSIPIPIPIPIPGKTKEAPSDPDLPKLPSWHQDHGNFEEHAAVDDQHPIVEYMKSADSSFQAYDQERSKTFRETVAKYRRRYGRNPPPGFREWYKFAKDRNAHNIDDFDQIMDDIRPFWGLKPLDIRSLARVLTEHDSISGIHIRKGKVWKITNGGWRVDTMASMLQKFVGYLPDMDIAMNRLDQPRVVVPWEDMQSHLAAEEKSRRVTPEATAEWTKDMEGLFKEQDDAVPLFIDAQWFERHGGQYMDIAKEACPPESNARNASFVPSPIDSSYKDIRGGFITDFNRSSDLCTVGPEIQDKHGFLFAPSTIIASKRLLPVFGECKVNVNSDILFPANMYYLDDDRYVYDDTFDYGWDDKKDRLVWRGVTSGGVNTADNWKKMHRQRLVMISNSTILANEKVRVMVQDPEVEGTYTNDVNFNASEFAADHSDVGFTEPHACVPDCNFYEGVWTYKNITTLSEQFRSKYLVDVDGHSFSGRWHAFLESKSLGIKSTIFREWHDSRLFAWRHFVPMDNRYDELYSILTYFLGYGKSSDPTQPYVPRHDFEARKLGRQGREWAKKVLRRDDIEIYMFRLMIEYARVIDDNRDRIGYSGDGSELDKYDSKSAMNPANFGHA
ncbi:hypothetical protein HYFRA_00011925 [Hymenoscyphus fraxineus]|uniref:Glycosyl transferase CAP10 domain-containing protein n=1 Tax=Hymenoscyphus fraxineus TaxID=746836 RepID=A0A9N9PK40_9HELO|nr:hypothetical protein HYFRA_00011925 [Hymenoscyphus fraxineus]